MAREMIPIIAIMAGVVIAIFYPLAKAYAKRMERGEDSPRLSSDFEARLARMEHTLESIAIEIERVSEGQRFTTKLLADRANADK